MNKIVFERSYPATLDEVWDLWTTKDGFESWWAPEGFRAEVLAVDARKGGVLHYAMIAATPETIAFMKGAGMTPRTEHRMRFTEVERPTRLRYVHDVDFVPGVKPYSSETVVQLAEQGGRVQMRIELDPMHSEEWTSRAKQGWESQLGKLDRRFAAR